MSERRGFNVRASRLARAEVQGEAPHLLLPVGDAEEDTRFDLPRELPLDVIEPVTDLDVNAGLLLSQALQLAQADRSDLAAQQRDAIGLLLDLITANQNLPASLLAAVKEMARRLLGQAAYEAFMAIRPSVDDVKELATYLVEVYGAALGEALRSSSSSKSGGATSPETSTSSTDSISGESGSTPEIPASLGSDDSGS